MTPLLEVQGFCLLCPLTCGICWLSRVPREWFRSAWEMSNISAFVWQNVGKRQVRQWHGMNDFRMTRIIGRGNDVRISHSVITVLVFILFSAFHPGVAVAADLDRAQIEKLLESAKKSKPADLRRKNLQGLDLSGMDLRNADLWGANLKQANLSQSNLSGLNLDLSVMVGINLSGANLSNTSIFGVHMGGADLSGANLRGSRIIATLDGANLSNADLSGADWGVDIKNQPMGQMRVSLKNANLSGARLVDANLNRAMLRFAKFIGADLQGTNLFRADLAGADFTRANLQGAELSQARLEEAIFREADLSGARFREIRGKSAIQGLNKAKNLNKAIFE